MFTIDTHTGKRYGRFFRMETAEKFLEKRGYFLSAGLTTFVKPDNKKKGNLLKVAKVIQLTDDIKPLNRKLLN